MARHNAQRFLASGDATLLKFDDTIQQCDAVIHLVGDQCGSVASEASRRSLLERHRDFPQKLGHDEATLAALAYTQWEAWLAVYHRKTLFIAVPAPGAVPDSTVSDAAGAEAQRRCQQAHLAALRKHERYPEIAFASSDKLCLALLRGKLHELLPPPTIPINLPPSLGRLFKGRDEWLVRIRAALRAAGKRGVDASRVALWGMGGLGKSRLATEYAHTFAHEHSALLAITAATPEDLTRGLANLTGVLKLPQASATDLHARYQATLDWLDDPTHRGWLLLVDNVDDDASFVAVEELLRRLHHGRVILTGRIKDWPDYVADLHLDILRPEHAVEYLLDATAGKHLAEPAGPEADQAMASILAQELDGLALALTQAAGAIRKRVLSFADYLADWRGRRAELLDDPDFDPRRTGYPRTVAVTWLTSYAQLLPASALPDDMAWIVKELRLVRGN